MLEKYIAFLTSTVVFLATTTFSLRTLQSPNINLTVGSIFPGSLNTSLRHEPKYDCSGGPEYGDEILLDSCESAQNALLASLPYSYREILIFGDRRGRGGSGVDVPLPYISISCKSAMSHFPSCPRLLGRCYSLLMHVNPAADGACAIEVVSRDVSRSDFATLAQFRQWSRTMIIACMIDDNEVRGGIAGNLGQCAAGKRINPMNIMRDLSPYVEKPGRNEC